MSDVTLAEALDALERMIHKSGNMDPGAIGIMVRAGRARWEDNAIRLRWIPAAERPPLPAGDDLVARLRHHADEIESLGRDMDWPEHDGGWDTMHALRTAANLLDEHQATSKQPAVIPPAVIRGAFEAGWEAAEEGHRAPDNYTVDDAWAEYEYPPVAGCVPLEELEAIVEDASEFMASSELGDWWRRSVRGLIAKHTPPKEPI